MFLCEHSKINVAPGYIFTIKVSDFCTVKVKYDLLLLLQLAIFVQLKLYAIYYFYDM